MPNLKKMAAERAVQEVRSGMVVGLGSGSTARYAVERIGEMLRAGQLIDIVGIPTSKETECLAIQQGIPLTTLQQHPLIDLTIDGADEIDHHLRVIKGGGAALLHEKIVASATRCQIIIVDQSKVVSVLGRFPLPVEVVRFGWPMYVPALERLGCRAVLRLRDGQPVLTDEGNYVVDCHFGQIHDAARLEQQINMIPGVVDNGLFIGLVHRAFVATDLDVYELKST